jgi:small-conductance mechanosensitive channel
MGGLGSKNKVQTTNEIINNVLTNIVMELSSSCKAISSNSQKMSGNDINISFQENTSVSVDFRQDITSKLSATCIQTQSAQAKLQNEFKAQLDKEVEQMQKGLSALSTNESNTINKLKNDIITNVNIKSLTECLTHMSNNQEMINNKLRIEFNKGSDIKVSMSQKIIASLISECIQSNEVVQDACNKLDNIVKEKTKQSQIGFDLNDMIKDIGNTVSGIFDSFSNIIIIVIIAFLVLILFAPKFICKIPILSLKAKILGIC